MPASGAPATTAIEFAIGIVAARSWPEKKLREKVRARYSEEETEAAIARLRELRMVDDVAWAERFTRDRFERVSKGRHRIRMELLRRGIAAETADAAIASVLGVDDEREKAARLLETLRARLGGGSAAKRGSESAAEESQTRAAQRGARRPSAEQSLKNRLFRRMLARGYPASLVRDLLDVS